MSDRGGAQRTRVVGFAVIVGVLGTQVSCDDTLFNADVGIQAYTPDWAGVTAFLDDHCVVCHRVDGSATVVFPDDLATDIWTNTGRFVVPQDPEASALWRVIDGSTLETDFGTMPLGVDLLPAETVAHVREWILAGAQVDGSPADEDQDGYSVVDGDCDDADATVFPGGVEVCDGADNDCDFATDEGLTVAGFVDADQDGFGAGAETQVCPDEGADNASDCDDTSDQAFPGGTEVCGDQLDNDCDGAIDEAGASDASDWYVDLDGDGYGHLTTGETACSAPIGYVADNTDCDDAAASTNPGAAEVCDTANNDCDAYVDEGPPAGAPTWYRDSDRDDFGSSADTLVSCDQPVGYVANGGDCDDGDSRFYPGAPETNCTDPNDYNCDGATGATDQDNDGHAACAECDDLDPNSYPGANEVCDSADNDCNGLVDDGASDAQTFYVDSDGDGFGGSGTVLACVEPADTSATSTDCDDGDSLAYPGATERCNGTDDDCDSTVDESAVGSLTFYRDGDGDGYGDALVTQEQCSATSGWVADASDCDDGNVGVHPGVVNDPGDGVDNDCDGAVDEDAISTTNYTDVQAIWDGSCMLAGCHSAVLAAGDLRLNGDSWPNLVNAPSGQAPLDLVEPYSSQDSYLWHKLNDTHTTVGGSGSMMPKRGSLSGAELATIEAWILDGAPR
ncbi:MAG: putative metal-binding motif-containing protein [Proteobacteria bacterium]|nr:putative metal-binding motif-containing protein [Pseudomonadota bacterium]